MTDDSTANSVVSDVPEPESADETVEAEAQETNGSSSDAVVEEIVVTEEVTLPSDGALLDVVEIAEYDDADEEPEPRPYDRPGRWFVVHTDAGHENKVKQTLAGWDRSTDVEERMCDDVITMEDVIQFKTGRKVVVQK